MVVRRVHQHSDLGLKIRRVSLQNMMLLLHVDVSLNGGGLVGSQGGCICGVTDQSLLEEKSAPWTPLAWCSFKLSRAVPSSLGAEAQAMSVALEFVEWATLFLQELSHGPFDLRGALRLLRRRGRQHVSQTARACTTICRLLEARQRCKTSGQPLGVLVIRESSEEDRLRDMVGGHRGCSWRMGSQKTREKQSNASVAV